MLTFRETELFKKVLKNKDTVKPVNNDQIYTSLAYMQIYTSLA